MKKIKITVVTIGYMPTEFNKRKIKSLKSKVFSIEDGIQNYSITRDSDGGNWEFTDSRLEELLPKEFEGDFLIAIVNVPLELNWYTRRLSENKVVFTLHEMKDILKFSNIPLENLVYRILYASALIFMRNERNIPLNNAKTNFTHDETRGCLFDMNANKMDAILSCCRPIICPDCIERMRKENVSNETIESVIKEIKRIKKPLFFRIADWIKRHPIWAIVISSVIAIILGGIGSYFATTIYDIINGAT